MRRLVLITGAAGFLGRAFVRYHKNSGDDVIAIDDMSNPYSYWTHSACSTQIDAGEWFKRNREEFRSSSPIVDIAYHFAASVGGRIAIENDPLFNADSLRLDAAFFQWALVHRPKVAVYPSSSAVYGVILQGEEFCKLHESMFDANDPNWEKPDEIYGFTKLVGEVLAAKAAKAYGLDTLCIRPFSGYGEDQSIEYPVPSIARRAAARLDPLVIWGSGKQTRDFIHVSDIVGATIARIETGVTGYQTMNIGSGKGTSFNELALLFARIAKYEPVIRTDESKPVGVLNRVAEITRMQSYYTPEISLGDGMAEIFDRAEAQSGVF